MSVEVMQGVANPTFAITDKWMVVSLIPQGVELFLMREQGKLPSWKPEGELAKVMEGLPQKFSGLAVADPRPLVKLGLGLATVGVPAFRAAAAMQSKNQQPFKLAAADIPPVEVMMKPLFPNVMVSYRDGNNMVWQSRTSVAGGNNSAAVVGGLAVGIALLLPAVQQAREAARRSQSKNNLKQLGIAMHNYHDTHNSLPRGTVDQKGLKPDQRLSWLVSLLPFIEQASLYQQFSNEQAWNRGANKRAAMTRVPVFLHPSIPPGPANEPAQTNYVGWAGCGNRRTQSTGEFS